MEKKKEMSLGCAMLEGMSLLNFTRTKKGKETGKMSKRQSNRLDFLKPVGQFLASQDPMFLC